MTYRLAVILMFMGALYILSAMPGPTRPDDWVIVQLLAQTPPMVQKILHVVLYGGLSWLWFWVLEPLPVRLHFHLLAAFLIAAGFGALNEWNQLHVLDRYGSLTDVLLNSMGAGLGLLVAVLWTGPK